MPFAGGLTDRIVALGSSKPKWILAPCVRRRDMYIGLDESDLIQVLMYLVYFKLISELGTPL